MYMKDELTIKIKNQEVKDKITQLRLAGVDIESLIFDKILNCEIFTKVINV